MGNSQLRYNYVHFRLESMEGNGGLGASMASGNNLATSQLNSDRRQVLHL